MRALRRAPYLLAFLPAIASAQVLGRDAEVFTRNEPIARGEWFSFHSPIGDVTVTEGTGTQIELRAEKILRRQGRITDIGFKLLRTGSGVTICAVIEDEDVCDENGYRSDRRYGWGNIRPPSMNVTIRVPAGVRLRAVSGNGDVSVAGAYAELVARSGNGEVRVTGTAGEVDAASGNGEVTVENVRGPVEASSGNGDVSVTTVQGPVSARSGNGDLRVRMTELRVADDMQFTTGNGRIIVTVPTGFNADIDASTSNGGINSDFPIEVSGRLSKTRIRGTIGQGGRRIRLVTGNGEIELRRG